MSLRARTAAGAAFVVIAAAAAVASLGGLTVYDPPAAGAGRGAPGPSWARPCYGRPARPDRSLLHFCARARGTVVFVRRQRRQECTEVHFLLVARFRLLIVKLAVGRTVESPRLGSRVTVVGPLLRARYGLREIQGWRVDAGDRRLKTAPRFPHCIDRRRR